MKLTDLEQRLIVPITDQTRGGIQYEVEISLEELLKGTLEDFEPEVVDAVPVGWLEAHSREYCEDWGTLCGAKRDGAKRYP